MAEHEAAPARGRRARGGLRALGPPSTSTVTRSSMWNIPAATAVSRFGYSTTGHANSCLSLGSSSGGAPCRWRAGPRERALCRVSSRLLRRVYGPGRRGSPDAEPGHRLLDQRRGARLVRLLAGGPGEDSSRAPRPAPYAMRGGCHSGGRSGAIHGYRWEGHWRPACSWLLSLGSVPEPDEPAVGDRAGREHPGSRQERDGVLDRRAARDGDLAPGFRSTTRKPRRRGLSARRAAPLP